MNPAFVLRADGDARLGIGHVKRCIALARALAERGATADIVVRRGDSAVVSLIEAAAVPMHLLPEATDLADEAAALDSLALASDAGIVLDVSHRETLRQARAIPGYFEALAARFRPLIVIDSLHHECLVGGFDIPVDLAVIPYAGAEEQEVAAAGVRLALGPDYFPLDAAYARHVGTPREIRADASRVLVTAGGGDAGGITEKSLAALQCIDDRKLEVRVVLGPAFTAATRRAIRRRASASRHRVTHLAAPGDLAAPMAWCDLAISASGLTKYDFAATATPAVLLSVDPDHAAFHRPFERLGTAWHLGVAATVPVPALAAAVRSLLADAGARARMSAAGTTVVDGRGMQRTVDLMLDVAAATAAAPARRRRLAS